jgi:hypothetical protein
MHKFIQETSTYYRHMGVWTRAYLSKIELMDESTAVSSASLDTPECVQCWPKCAVYIHSDVEMILTTESCL